MLDLKCTETSELINFFINLLDAYRENFYYSCEVFSLYLRKGKMILDTGTQEYLYCCRTTKILPDYTVNSCTITTNTTTTTTTTITTTTTTTTTSTTNNNNNYYNNKHCNSKEFSLLSCV
jgi:hypothetical protein